MVLENQYLHAEISEHGAELCSLIDRRDGRERIWQADPAFWNRHAPVLFPFVGRVSGDHYHYKGNTYAMKQHGFARDMNFTCTLQKKDEAVFFLQDTAETREVYPFSFILNITYILHEQTLDICFKVENPSCTDKLYYSVGAHPAFNLFSWPDSGVQLCMEREQYTIYHIDPASGGIMKDQPETLKTSGGLLPLSESLFERDALIFDDADVQQVTLLQPAGAPLTVTSDGFSSYGIWKKPGAPFVCLEPWLGRCFNRGFDGELQDKYGEQMLLPGQSHKVSYRIALGN